MARVPRALLPRKETSESSYHELHFSVQELRLMSELNPLLRTSNEGRATMSNSNLESFELNPISQVELL